MSNIERRLERVAEAIRASTVVCICPPHPLIVFSSEREPDTEPCPAHGPVRIIEWPLSRSALDACCEVRLSTGF